MDLLSALRRTPNALAMYRVVRDVESSVRLHFLHAASDCGLLGALKTSATNAELVERLGGQRPELLDVLLELGLALKELSESNGRYTIRGRRSRAVASEAGDPLLAMIEEMVTYHADVYRQFTPRLRGGALGNYLDEFGTVIARSSRVLDPFVRSFVRSLAGTGRPVRILEVGCGSGIYLRYAAEANPQVTGVALDLQPLVVEQARANLTAWGVADRFQVLVADIRNPPPEVAGPFDLITLYNNVYYFDEDERPALFRRFRSWLAPGGAFALVSLFHGRTFASLDLDLALRSTVGHTALPDLDTVRAQLKEGGFGHVKTVKLMPVEPLYGLAARPEAAP